MSEPGIFNETSLFPSGLFSLFIASWYRSFSGRMQVTFRQHFVCELYIQSLLAVTQWSCPNRIARCRSVFWKSFQRYEQQRSHLRGTETICATAGGGRRALTPTKGEGGICYLARCYVTGVRAFVCVEEGGLLSSILGLTVGCCAGTVCSYAFEIHFTAVSWLILLEQWVPQCTKILFIICFVRIINCITVTCYWRITATRQTFL